MDKKNATAAGIAAGVVIGAAAVGATAIRAGM